MMLRRTTKRILLVAGCLGVLLASSGCQKEAESPPPLTPQDKIAIADNGRFQLVPMSEGLALDTRTGLLCATTTLNNDKQTPLCLDLLMNADAVVKQVMDSRKVGNEGR